MNKAKERIYTDFLIIGSGGAGLTAALTAAESGKEVLLVTKRRDIDCNTRMAQGGISCVMDPADSFESHIHDTIVAGAGLCNIDAVKAIVEQGPERINDLMRWGVNFSRRSEMEENLDAQKSQEFDLGREGGHSCRRVLHSGDITGMQMIDAMLLECERHKNIKILTDCIAIDLLSTQRMGIAGENTVYGAYVLNTKESVVYTVMAQKTILATGGAGKVYLYTTNPNIATGGGIAMAYRSFATISNMEFFQFHPTALYHPSANNFLISEAVRGEGAILKIRKNDKMVPFMDNYHSMASLAPRDIVARAIDKELKSTGEKSVFLDITHHDEDFLRRRFPNIFQKCLECGINMATDLIPVVPAAHYCCGGIATDVNGFTNIKNLYAVGETACTGLHGANRLASNSLLEAVVTGHNSVADALTKWENLSLSTIDIPAWNSGDAINSDEQVVITHNWQELRQFMWDYVGIFRTDKRLQRAKSRIELLKKEIEQYYWNFIITRDLLELRNLIIVAELIIDSAIARKESRGLHFNADKLVDNSPNTARQSKITRKN